MKQQICCWAVLLCIGVLFFATSGFSKPTEEYQINVIRPKYFVKKSRTELGADLAAVLNQTFTYTYLMSGAIVYHLTDSWGLGVTGAYGFTVNKEDRDVLENTFSITVDIFTTKWVAEASVLWTPVYGKYQLTSGRLVYFDTYISAGFGMMGISIQSKKEGERVNTPFSCYSPVIGAGQRFYLNKKTSLRWQIRNHIIWYNGKRCLPEAPIQDENEATHSIYQTIVTQVGISYFI